MGVARFLSTIDSFITNAHPEHTLDIRASGSNFGHSPLLNVFARKDDIVSGSIELSRALIKFDTTYLSQSIFIDKTIPSSSVSYILHMFDHKHGDTIPTSYDLFVYPLSQSWDEGTGIDIDRDEDEGWVNWLSGTSTTTWAVTGSDFVTTMSASQHFDAGDEDLIVDITQIVNEWLSGNLHYGAVVKFGTTEETNSVNYYRKAFHSRQSLFVDKIPFIEARWNSVLKDQRHNFALDQQSTLVLYNYIRGEPTTLSPSVVVTLKDSLVSGSASYSSFVTASEYKTGIFTASFTISSTGSHSASFYDIWTSAGLPKVTGSFVPLKLTGTSVDVNDKFVVSMPSFKRVYDKDEEIRFRAAVRKQDFVTHVGIMATASLEPEVECIEKMYYRVLNEETGEEIIAFGTGSVPYTQLSYDKYGNYFDLSMKSFVPGFQYEFQFLLDLNNDKQVVGDKFFFKVR